MVLYTVCAGVPLACREAAGRKELSSPFVVFPEQFIRDVAAALLSTLAREVVETPQLVDRLSYALVFTRNIKLRGNIFASVLMLVADSVELRRYTHWLNFSIVIFLSQVSTGSYGSQQSRHRETLSMLQVVRAALKGRMKGRCSE